MMQYEGTHGVMVIVVGRGHSATRVQILNDAVYISHSTNILGKSMNPVLGKE